MSQSENRQYTRHPVSYTVEVKTRENPSSARSETLHDISDGGISFITEDADAYQIDQRIEIGMKAPNQKDSTISLQGAATIIWIHHDPFSLQSANIGVHFDELIESENLVD